MAEQPWFKVWAQPVLGSVDLNDFSDHEERVWWRLLCVASGQVERWHVTVGMAALARMCCSTPPKTKAALSRFEALGMVHTDGSGGWWISNWEKYQETPEARRQRLKRERDRQRDMSRDESRPMSRQEDKRLEVRSLSDPTDLQESEPQRRPRSRKPKGKPLTEEQRAGILTDFEDIPYVVEEIEYALGHVAHEKVTDDNLYLRRWLRQERAKLQKGGTNGRTATRGGNDAEHADQLAYFKSIAVQ